jgi:uncharacterized membrane protein
MSNEDIRKMIDDTYDDSREVSFRSMLGEFYNRKMLSIAVMVWVMGLVFIAVAIYSAVRFFGSDQTRDQIYAAALFICFINSSG